MITSINDRHRSNVSDETTPFGVFLAKSDSSEEKLLFRYPYNVDDLVPLNQLKKSKYALVPKKSDGASRSGVFNDQTNNINALLPAYTELTSSVTLDSSNQDITKIITDSQFSNLFGAIKHKLCDQKFELKVDHVRFVGHPTLIEKHCFHVVFALKANAQQDVVKSYHELSQHIAIALKSEEKRCKYFSEQSKIMIECHDKYAAIQASQNAENLLECTSPYKLILERSLLAKNLKTVFDQLSNVGIVNIKINDWINLNFCLPQKVYRKLMASPSTPAITPANIQECLNKLRPYHTFLLFMEVADLLNTLPQDISPSFVRLVRVANPLKNLLELAADADITLPQVFNIVAQLIYWGKATIIFPLCESNIYMLHPSAPTGIHSPLVKEFQESFPNDSLLKVLSKFSLSLSLGQLKNPMDSAEQECKFVQILIWLLKKRLLIQLHTYVLFVPLKNGSPFLTKKLSFSQSLDRPSSTLTELNEVSITTGSYQSEASFSLSPISNSLLTNHEYKANSSLTNEFELTKHEDNLSFKQSSEFLLQNVGFSQEEINAVLSTPAADNLDDIHMFAKLCHYFDGHHHIEDIMYYENLRRSQILTIIDKFRDVLITCQYEDTTVAELLPYKMLQ